MAQIQALDPRQAVQLFTNMNMLNTVVTNLMDIANQAAKDQGFRFHFVQAMDEDEANLEVTLSVLEEYEVVNPPGPPDIGPWTDNDGDGIFVTVTKE